MGEREARTVEGGAQARRADAAPGNTFRPRSRAGISWWLVALGLAWLAIPSAPSAADEVRLTLVDGRVLSGTDVRRDGAEYVLTLASGEKIAMPAPLVASVGLAGEASAPAPAPAAVRVGEPEPLAGVPPPPGPSGLRQGEPEVLAGVEVQAPSTREQLAVFGEPARFRKSVIDPTWHPKSDWDMDPARQNNFAPSKWAGDIVDPTWQPESAWNEDDDVMAKGRSTWKKSIIDPTWTPTDGFAK